jgi:Na+/glutamate symporter
MNAGANIKLLIATGGIILGLVGGLLGASSISKEMFERVRSEVQENKDKFESHSANQQVDELREENRLTKIETILEQHTELLRDIRDELRSQ